MNNQHKHLFHEYRHFSVVRSRQKNARCRRGVSYAEVLVSATVLTMIMSLVTVSSFRISRVWKDIRKQKVALSELSNQLDRLTMLPVEKVKDSVDTLKPTDECRETLNQPAIAGVVEEEPEIGHRLTISITWQNDFGERSRPLQLSAWWPESSDQKVGQP